MNIKSITKFSITLILAILIVFEGKTQLLESNNKSLVMLPGEGWWGGVVHQGVKMPYGKDPVSVNLYGNDAGNQAVPLLISNKGRYIWSEKPFRYSFRNDSLLIDKTYGEVSSGQSGTTLKDAYLYASRQFFPATGQWPDSLLVTSPQYNLWIN
jgi:alpha-glucosidase